MKNKPYVSFIIPCKNEEKYIKCCIDALLSQVNSNINYEVIVVDNGSTDQTLAILKKYGDIIKLYRSVESTVSSVRNYGAMQSNGEWYAFIDGDVEVDINWLSKFLNFVKSLDEKNIDIKKVITGSTCEIPKISTWVQKVWFEQLRERDKKSQKYVNSGNLIIHRELFKKIGGFNTLFKTGEDVKLCNDARMNKGQVIKSNSIKAIHHGYPKDIVNFFKRERWHGLNLIRYFKYPWKSKDLILALYLIIVLILYLCLNIFFKNNLLFIAFFFIMQIAPLFIFSILRYRKNMLYVFGITFLFYVYGLAKVISLYDIAFNKNSYKKNSD